MKRAFVLLLVLPLAACTSTPTPVESPRTGPTVTVVSGASVELPAMTLPRAGHSATALADGRVLIAGGCTINGCNGMAEGGRTEFYVPRSQTFEAGPRMVQARAGHTATALSDGRILYVGGYPEEGRPPLAAAEVFDPASGAFTGVGPMSTGRGAHTATRLRDGRVLIAGGVDAFRALSTVEIFDPKAGTFTTAAPLPSPRATHVAGLLADGRVLVAGGQTQPGHGRGIVDTAVIYDPARDQWTPVGPLRTARYKSAFAALPDGSAYVVGGQTADDAQTRLTTVERYDPASGAFTEGPMLSEPRYKISDAVVVLRDGRVVVAGGYAVDVIGPDFAVRRITSEHPVERQQPAATELADGSVLVTGGYDDRTRVTATAVLVRP